MWIELPKLNAMILDPSACCLSFPVDHTRVVLNDPNEPGSDYINANIIMVNSAATVKEKLTPPTGTRPNLHIFKHFMHDNVSP